MNGLQEFIEKINSVVWGAPLLILILVTGIYLTLRLRGLQVTKLGKAFKFMLKDEEGGEGEVTSFGALCTALSATIGTGNIVGVATAISAGGPGALFWMMVAAFFGMAIKYAEGFLSIKYRKVYGNGHTLGGPFYYIEYGMGKKYRWLAKAFAVFGSFAGLLGIGTFAQVNGITGAIKNFADPNNFWSFKIFNMSFSWWTVITGVIVTVLAGFVIIGGVKRIAKVSEFIVPAMAILYVLCTVIILVCNYKMIPDSLKEIFEGAFGVNAITGGALGTALIALQKGVSRGLFSTEAGLGSAPIASSAAKTNDPVRQGLVAMTGTFDTMIICLMTGLSIVVCGSWKNNLGLQGVEITTHSFQTGLPFPKIISSGLLMICLVFFAFTTIIGWNYYGERCIEYFMNGNKTAVTFYRWAYIFAVFVGPYITVSLVWSIADIANGLMAIPNIIALIALSKIVCSETNKYY